MDPESYNLNEIQRKYIPPFRILMLCGDEFYIYTISTFDAYQNNHDMAILNPRMHLEGLQQCWRTF